RALPDTHPIRRPEVYRPDALLAARPRRAARRKAAVGPALADELSREGECIRLATSVARSWRLRTTVGIEGECYEVTAHDENDGRHVYRLRPVPAGTAIRGVQRYP